MITTNNTNIGDYETWMCHLVRSLKAIDVHQLSCKEADVKVLYNKGLNTSDAAKQLIIYKSK